MTCTAIMQPMNMYPKRIRYSLAVVDLKKTNGIKYVRSDTAFILIEDDGGILLYLSLENLNDCGILEMI